MQESKHNVHTTTHRASGKACQLVPFLANVSSQQALLQQGCVREIGWLQLCASVSIPVSWQLGWSAQMMCFYCKCLVAKGLGTGLLSLHTDTLPLPSAWAALGRGLPFWPRVQCCVKPIFYVPASGSLLLLGALDFAFAWVSCWHRFLTLTHRGA